MLCVGFGKACEVAFAEIGNDKLHISKLANKLIQGLK